MLLDTNVVLALMWRNAYGHEAAHAWIQQANHFFTTPSTEWAALRVSLRKAQGNVSEVLAALTSIVRHRKQKPAMDARLPDTDWPVWRHLHGHKLTSDFWLLATAEALDTELVTLDAKAWQVLPPPQRRRIRILPVR